MLFFFSGRAALAAMLRFTKLPPWPVPRKPTLPALHGDIFFVSFPTERKSGAEHRTDIGECLCPFPANVVIERSPDSEAAVVSDRCWPFFGARGFVSLAGEPNLTNEASEKSVENLRSVSSQKSGPPRLFWFVSKCNTLEGESYGPQFAFLTGRVNQTIHQNGAGFYFILWLELCWAIVNL